MGAKSSKPEGFVRAASFRKSQKTTLQKIERKLNKTSKDIDKFKGTIDDSRYTKIKQNISEIIDDLEKINATVKDKYKDVYQKILDRCNDELQKLDSKVTSSPSLSPVVSPTPDSPRNVHVSPTDSPLSERSSVQLKLVKIALDEQKKQAENIKNQEEDEVNEDIQKGTDLEQDTVDKIDAMRKKIEYLETEIHMYKSEPDDNLYGFIRENLNQIIVKLDTLETFGNIQIKHERKLALQRALDCMKYLNDGVMVKNFRDETPPPEVELHEDIRNERERLSKRSTYRPITLNLNINEKFNEELHNVIHKRIEEAARENDKPVVKEKLAKSANNVSTDESFENFDNPDSEDEFDFVNVDDEKEGSKSAPVLVTSF